MQDKNLEVSDEKVAKELRDALYTVFLCSKTLEERGFTIFLKQIGINPPREVLLTPHSAPLKAYITKTFKL